MNKTLICYFSASGTTREVAEKISSFLNSDLFEIIPSNLYTDEDLNWNDENSRSSIEMNDSSSRPKIRNKVPNLNDYQTIILGFPVWWYTAPTIINTFLEENDLTKKNIYVFVTSGGSDSLSSFNNLRELYPNLNFINHKRFGKNITTSDINGLLRKD